MSNKSKTKKVPVFHHSVRRELSGYFSASAADASLALQRLSVPSESDALHDLRVYLRSLRVLLNLFPHSRLLKKHKEQFHEAITLTNHYRDLEVAIGLAKSLMQETSAGPVALSFLEAKLAATQANVVVALQSMQLPDMLMSASHDWDKKISNQSKRVLRGKARSRARRLTKQVMMAASDLQLTSPISEWHFLRIRVKHLRYWNEGFAVFLSVKQHQQLPLLIQLQRCLGAVHDYYVFNQQFSADMPMPEQWKELLARWHQRALTDSAGLLMQLKQNSGSERGSSPD